MLDSLLSLIAPHYCIECGSEGAVLCQTCKHKLVPIPERCYNCRTLMQGGKTCKACYRKHKVHSFRAVTPYAGNAKKVIWELKFNGTQAVAKEVAPLLMNLLPAEKTNILITHAPTATRRIRSRGYDQAALLARAVAAKSGVPCIPTLARVGHQKQMGANKATRQKQLLAAFRPINTVLIRDSHIVLIDDVLTTGSTIEACTAVLRAAGAKRVDVITFAQA